MDEHDCLCRGENIEARLAPSGFTKIQLSWESFIVLRVGNHSEELFALDIKKKYRLRNTASNRKRLENSTKSYP